MENQVEMEEKTRLINQVLELQHTLEGNRNFQTITKFPDACSILFIRLS